MTRVWADLTAEQADGLACVVCGRDFAALWWGAKSHPVGRAVDGAQVFACVEHDELVEPAVSTIDTSAGAAVSAARLDEAAAALCDAWLDSQTTLGPLGKHSAQFGALTEDGRDVWRGLVRVVTAAFAGQDTTSAGDPTTLCEEGTDHG